MRIRYYIILTLVILLCRSSTLSAQPFFDLSENGKYYVRCFQKSKDFSGAWELRLFHIPTQNPVLTHSLVLEEWEKIKELKISPDGKTIAVITNKETTIIDVLSKSVVRVIPGSGKVIFPWYDNFFLIDNQELTMYDCFTGKKIRVLDKSEDKGSVGRKVWVSKDDNFIVSQDPPNSISLWDTKTKRLLKRFSGTNLSFDYTEKTITVFRGSKAYTYSLNKMQLISRQDFGKLATAYAKEQRLLKNSIIPEPYSGIPAGSGKFIFIPYTLPQQDRKNLLLISTIRKSVIPLNSVNLTKFDTCHWVTDTTFVLRYKRGLSKLLTTTGHFYMSDIKFRNKDVVKNRISPDFKWNTKKGLIFGQQMTVKSTTTNQKKRFAKTKLVAFTPDSKYLVVQKGDNLQGVIIAGKSEFFPFHDSIIPIKELPFDDTEPPVDYISNQITSYKYISERSDTSSDLRIILKNIEINDSVVSINVHLIDTSGIYYYGAAADPWKKIWCNFLLKDPSGRVRQITDFTVTEHTEKDKVPVAIALVLDHSGSMGLKRTTRLQVATQTFIMKKQPDDALAIFKYDTKIGIESRTETELDKLLQNFQINGVGVYGGGTSLLDAINIAISELKNQRYHEKSVVILTDGYENSSMLSRPEVIKRANSENIKIHTIGYGPFISTKYLKYLSNNTEGTFYRIYRQGDFDWIFNDIYSKTKNYYEIRFNISDFGKMLAILKICYNNGADTLSFSFLHRKPDQVITYTDNDDNFFQYSDISDNSGEEKRMLDKSKDITDFTRIKTDSLKASSDTVPDFTISDTTDITIIDDEFEQIRFPDIKFNFDKTEIIPGTDKGIDDVVKFLNKYPDIRIEIRGHTDNKGDSLYNIKLSADRALTVKQLLISMNINGNRIDTRGYGEEVPLLENTTDANRLMNRRVEFVIVQ